LFFVVVIIVKKWGQHLVNPTVITQYRLIHNHFPQSLNPFLFPLHPQNSHTPFHGTLFTIAAPKKFEFLHSSLFSQNMRFRYTHAVIPLLSSSSSCSNFFTMNTQTLFNSIPFSNLKKPFFLQTHRFQPKRGIFTVFCAKRSSKYPPSPLKTNGYHGASTAKVPRPGKVSRT
jgi:hypothetical protein